MSSRDRSAHRARRWPREGHAAPPATPRDAAPPRLAYAVTVGSPRGHRAGQRDRRRRGRAAPRRARRPHPREPAQDGGAAAPVSLAVRPRGTGRDLLPHAGRQSCITPASRSRWSSPTRSSGPSTPRRWFGSTYQEAPSTTTIEQARDRAYVPERIFGGLIPGRIERGDVECRPRRGGGTSRCDVPLRRQPPQPASRPSATTAVWDDGQLTLHDTTHGDHRDPADGRRAARISRRRTSASSRSSWAAAFGCKAMIWPHVTLAALAARQVGRPVKLVAHPRADVHLLRPSRRAGATRRRSARPPTAGSPRCGITSSRSRRRSTTGRSRPWAVSAQAYACPELRGRLPAHPGQHDDADVHPRSRRIGRDVRARVRDGRARLRAGTRPARAAAAEPRRRGSRERPALVQQGTEGVLPARRRALRLGRSESGAALTPRRATG